MNVSMKPRETTLNFTAAGGAPVKSVKATQEPVICIPMVAGGVNFYGSGEPVLGDYNGVMHMIINPDTSETYWLYLLCSKSINKNDLSVKRNNTVLSLEVEETYTHFVAYRCTTSALGSISFPWTILYKGEIYCEIKLTES